MNEQQFPDAVPDADAVEQSRDVRERVPDDEDVVTGRDNPLVRADIAYVTTRHGGAVFSMLSEFMVDWYAESSRWVDAVIKTAAAESPANRALLEGWTTHWLAEAGAALTPLADYAFDGEGATLLAELSAALRARVARLGLTITG